MLGPGEAVTQHRCSTWPVPCPGGTRQAGLPLEFQPDSPIHVPASVWDGTRNQEWLTSVRKVSSPPAVWFPQEFWEVPAPFRAGKQCQAEQEGHVEGVKAEPGWHLDTEEAPGGMGQKPGGVASALLLLLSWRNDSGWDMGRPQPAAGLPWGDPSALPGSPSPGRCPRVTRGTPPCSCCAASAEAGDRRELQGGSDLHATFFSWFLYVCPSRKPRHLPCVTFHEV